jgi:hypothetical protein
LSSNELCFFYALDWSDSVIDIREQFPLLDLELAMNIADKFGIRYPYDNDSGFPYVLTSDFMISTTSGLKVRTIKAASELDKRRVLEKLEIEREYWKTQGIDWGIVTDKEINRQKASNIEWFKQAKELTDFMDANSASAAAMRFLEHCLNLDITYLDIAKKVEVEFGLRKGTGVCIFKHLTYKKMIAVDINTEQLPVIMTKQRHTTTTMAV